LVLRHEQLQLVIDPSQGGAIREFNCNGRPVLRPTREGVVSDPMEVACFPMVPYANRVARGHFTFGAIAVHLSRNWDRDPHPLHGQGWRLPWTVLNTSASSATLEFEGGVDEWPWHYRARQHCELHINTLTMTLSVENLAPTPMPVMLGLHPYFCDTARALVQADLPSVWKTNHEFLPTTQISTPNAWSFNTARPIISVPLDHCFSGWNGRAKILWPDHSVSLQATNCQYLHVYAPSGQDFFCLEPLSAPVGVLNRGMNDIPCVQPGKCFEIEMRLEVEVT
jgi:aldose 1-epimerase